MKRIILGLLAAASVSACAQSPASIPPVSMGDAYSSVSCVKAQRMLQQEMSLQPSLYAAQQSAQAGDAIGVFLIGVPVSSLAGNDMEGEIAANKGKILALQARLSAC